MEKKVTFLLSEALCIQFKKKKKVNTKNRIETAIQ